MSNKYVIIINMIFQVMISVAVVTIVIPKAQDHYRLRI